MNLPQAKRGRLATDVSSGPIFHSKKRKKKEKEKEVSTESYILKHFFQKRAFSFVKWFFTINEENYTIFLLRFINTMNYIHRFPNIELSLQSWYTCMWS